MLTTLVDVDPSQILRLTEIKSIASHPDTSILQLVGAGRSSRSRDARDKLFGLFGLVPTLTQIIPDYHMSTEELYVLFTIKMMEIRKSLDILNYVEHWGDYSLSPHEIDSTPSWAVNWVLSGLARLLPPTAELEAGPLYFEHRPGSKLLKLKGIALGMVENSGNTFLEWIPRPGCAVRGSGSSRVRPFIVEQVQSVRWRQWDRLARRKTYPSGEDVREAYARTLVANARLDRVSEGASLTACYDSWVRFWRITGRQRGKYMEAYITNTAAQEREQAAAFMEAHQAAAYGRRFFVTRGFELRHKQRIRPLLRSWIHYMIYFAIQTVFGIYIRFAHAYWSLLHRALAIRHHHYHSPEYIQRDVATLSRVPEHLSVILKRRPQELDDGPLEALMNEVAELTVWSAAAGVPLLSVYEKTGVLKNYMRELHELVELRLASYFGRANCPTLRIYAPNYNSASAASSTNMPTAMQQKCSPQQQRIHIDLLLLSATDGRDTLVDLTRTLAEMAQSKKLHPKDITPELIDTEIMATTAITDQDLLDQPDHHQKPAGKEVGSGEPDLLIVFDSHVRLDGYPPWQIRLSEMFCVGDVGGDINAPTRVEYQSFLRALWKYAGAEMRFGK
ncbi:hypothetical protein DV737_g4057, partial [Chaetothyriales sp. CBS 132003]